MRILTRCLVGAILLYALMGATFIWKNVGGNPYRCARCTPEWAVTRFNLPADVKDEFLSKISRKESEPQRFMVHGNMPLRSVTFGPKQGQQEPQIRHDARTGWDPRKSYPATSYVVKRDSQVYRVVQVHACSNWVDASPPVAPVPLVVPPLPAQPVEDDPLIAFTCPQTAQSTS